MSLLSVVLACKTKAPIATITEKQTFQFPQDWLGSYAGTLDIIDIRNDTQYIDMKLTIGPPDGLGMYQWTIQYGEKDFRYYGLEAINPDKGHYRIDEYNSIKLDAFLKGDNLITTFSVLNRHITYHYQKVSDGINIRVHSCRLDPVSISGSEIINRDTVPEARSFRATGYQAAFLKQLTP